MKNMKKHSMHGFSMIELMVAVVVLSIGLLGMAALQAATLRNNQSANYRTQATNLAAELVDTARSYQARDVRNVMALLDPLDGTWSAACAINSVPNYDNCANGALTCDRMRLANKVCRTMPNGRVRVTNYVPTAGTLTIEICWSDDRSQTATTTGDCSGASEGLGGQPYRVDARL